MTDWERFPDLEFSLVLCEKLGAIRNRVSITLRGLALIVLMVPLAATAERTTAKSAAVVKVAFNKKLKRKIIVTGSDLTLYFFTADTNTTPSCYDDEMYHCSQLWHPYRSSEPPVAGPGAKASLVRSERHRNSPRQVGRGKPKLS